MISQETASVNDAFRQTAQRKTPSLPHMPYAFDFVAAASNTRTRPPTIAFLSASSRRWLRPRCMAWRTFSPLPSDTRPIRRPARSFRTEERCSPLGPGSLAESLRESKSPPAPWGILPSDRVRPLSRHNFRHQKTFYRPAGTGPATTTPSVYQFVAALRSAECSAYARAPHFYQKTPYFFK